MGSAQSVEVAAVAAALAVLVISGSPNRSSDNRCPHQEKPRRTGGVGDAAAQPPRFSDSTNACGAGEVEGNVVTGWLDLGLTDHSCRVCLVADVARSQRLYM